MFFSIRKHAEVVLIVQLVGSKIADLSCALYVIDLFACRKKETVCCFITNRQTNEETVLIEGLVFKFILFYRFVMR